MCVAPLRPEPKWFSSSSLGSTQVISSWNGMDLHGDCIMKGLRKSPQTDPGASRKFFNSFQFHLAAQCDLCHCHSLSGFVVCIFRIKIFQWQVVWKTTWSPCQSALSQWKPFSPMWDPSATAHLTIAKVIKSPIWRETIVTYHLAGSDMILIIQTNISSY